MSVDVTPRIWVGEAQSVWTDTDYIAVLLVLFQVEEWICACNSHQELGDLGDLVAQRSREVAQWMKVDIVDCIGDEGCDNLSVSTLNIETTMLMSLRAVPR